MARPDTLDFRHDIGDDGDIGIVLFSHYSIKEFLTSDRLRSRTPTVSWFSIFPGACQYNPRTQSYISTLLQLDNIVDKKNFRGFPLAGYAARNWVDHAQVDGVASQIRIGTGPLFDSRPAIFHSLGRPPTANTLEFFDRTETVPSILRCALWFR